MPDNDPDQVKLSQWWHNRACDARISFWADTILLLVNSGCSVKFYRGLGEECVAIIKPDFKSIGEFYLGAADNMMDALARAKDEFDLCRKVGPGDSADQSSSDEAA